MLLLPALIAAAACWHAAATTIQAFHQAQSDTSRITLHGGSTAARHTLTLGETVALREVREPQLSPDGRHVAFLVRQGFVDCNCYRTALYITSKNAHAPTKLLEEGAIVNLRWTPDGQFLTYLSSRSGSRQLRRLRPEGGQSEEVVTHRPGEGQSFRESFLDPREAARVGVESYEWSPDGLQVAFVARPATDSALVRHLIDGGTVYDDEQMWVFDILRKQWAREPAELWVYDLCSQKERRIWRAPRAGARSRSVGIMGISWSPRGNRIAFSYASGPSTTTGGLDYNLALIDLAAGTLASVARTDSMWEQQPVWSPDGSRLAFVSEFYPFLNNSGSLSTLGIFNTATRKIRYVARRNAGSVSRIWWISDGADLVFETSIPAGPQRGRAGLYRLDLVSGAVHRLTPPDYHISDCGVQVGKQLACVWQNPNVPPDPAIVDLANGNARTVAVVNPELGNVITEPVEELRWKNKSGMETNGYLIRPYDFVPGRRYPLLVIMYNFEGRFVTAAEWITNYPAQVFAREGFAVLLWNKPRYDSLGSSFAQASFADGFGPLSSLEAAVRLLDKQGLVDTSRVGIMGLSSGGRWAEFALTHSSAFHVASVSNDGDFNPGAYWLFGQQSYRTLSEKVLRGPPYGSTLSNWATFSPAMNAERVRAPVLMEANAEEAILGLEMFGALRRYGVPVEFVIYPDDGHVLMQPVHRLASMQRNLDWFSFWLLRRTDPDKRKSEQYQRWEGMRKQLQFLVGSVSDRSSDGEGSP